MKKYGLHIFVVVLFVSLILKLGAPIQVWAAGFENGSREKKIGSYYIWIGSDSQTIRISKSKKGKGTVLVKAAKGRQMRNCFSDGKTVYYVESKSMDDEGHTVDYIYQIRTNKKGKKYLNKVRNFSVFAAWYKGKVYMSCCSDEFWDLVHTYCLDTKTNKVRCVMKDAEVWMQQGKYLIASPNSGDVSPLDLYTYNCVSGKRVRITRKNHTVQIVGRKLYYAEYLNDSYEIMNTFRIRSCNLSGTGKKTIVKSIQATSIGKMTSKYVYYKIIREWGNSYYDDYYRYVIKTKKSQSLTASQYRE